MVMDFVNRRRFTSVLGGILGVSVGTLSSLHPARAGATPLRRSPASGTPPADDQLAIIELMARYAWAYDTDDAHALASTFTEEGILEVWGKVMASNKADFEQIISQGHAMRGDHGWQHLTNHHLFRDYDGQNCTVYSYYTMPESDPNGGNVTLRAMGYYVSHCVRIGGDWFFKKRSVSRWNGKAPVVL